MKTFRFSNGDEMPGLGLGTWKSRPGEVYQAVMTAVQTGYRHIDCAAIYRNEEEIGKAVNDLTREKTVRREDLWITSKLWNHAHRKDDVAPALEKTLKDLQVDYLDLYLIHWPVAIRPELGVHFPRKPEDFMTPEEAPLLKTWESFIRLKEQGLVRHIGVSNFNIQKLEYFRTQSDFKPELNQVEMHPYLNQEALVRYAEKHHFLLTAYSPLGSVDRPTAGRDNLPSLLRSDTVVKIAEKHEVSPARILIAFALQRGVAVIPKSVNPDHIRDNLEGAEVELTPEDMDSLMELHRNVRYIDGSVWTIEGSPYSMEYLWGKEGL